MLLLPHRHFSLEAAFKINQAKQEKFTCILQEHLFLYFSITFKFMLLMRVAEGLEPIPADIGREAK